jgi:outer membrane usher protein
VRTIVAGDFISAALTGARAIRFGGVQLRSNFGLRPDLVTFPLPYLGGSAVVPSSVDLYINNIRQFSGQAAGGPFVIDTLPAITGAGQASIVVQDPLGRRVTTTVPIYVDAQLLRQGLVSYALAMGYFRRNYGIASADYSSNPAGSGALRYGVTDAVTLEVRGEAASGLGNVGAGGWAQVGQYGVLGAWLGGSGGDGRGWQSIGEYRYVSTAWSLDVLASETHDAYRDLGSTQGVPVARRQQRLLFGLPFGRQQNISFAYNRTDAVGLRSRIATLSYSTNLGSSASFFAEAFQDLDASRVRGVYVGLSFTLGSQVTAYASAARLSDQTLASIGASRSIDYDGGGFGWTIQGDGSSAGDSRHALVRGSYLGAYGEVQATAERFRNASVGMLDARGGLVVMDGTLMASRAINDAFALVSTDGVAGVPVLRENRVVGNTDAGGYFVVPDLHAFRRNQLAIDASELPSDARISADQFVAVPRDGAGVLAHFPIDRYNGASLILVDPQGRPLPVGARATLLDSGRTALVGYDGLVFFENLAPQNRLRVEFDDSSCAVQVPYDSRAAMSTLGPFVCMPEGQSQ